LLLNAVIIVLREVLEASLLASTFLAISQMLQRDRKWIFFAFSLGLVMGSIYALSISSVSMMFGGAGQEILNASMQTLIYLSLLVFAAAVPHQNKPLFRNLTIISLVFAVVLSLSREGSEVLLFITGFIGVPTLFNSVLLGGAVGAGIGLSVGVFFYYLLIHLTPRFGVWLGYVILLLISGSMMSQAVEFMMQADIFSSTAPVWDSSSLISERSISGQLLYALIGYEATPTLSQVIAYIGSMTLFIVIAITSSTLREKHL